MNPRLNITRVNFSNLRFNIFYSLLILILALFVVRLFYIQVIEHQTYKTAALDTQLKEYKVPAERGVIEARDGAGVVPIVLNEEVYTLFADPVYISDIEDTANKLAQITGVKAPEYEEKMNAKTRYAVLEKKLGSDVKDKIEKLAIKGVGLRAESIRTYPQGVLAAQILGFVNDEGEGTYGVEQFMDEKLRGKPGQLKAITDSKGIPLVSNRDNILKDPEPGQRLLLSVDIGMQRRAEKLLADHLKSVRSKSGSVIILDPNSGAVKAMANLPSYNPAEFYKESDASVFTNDSVNAPLEVGSIMKTLTVAAGLNEGAIKADTTFYDPAKFEIDGATVRNVEEDGGAQTRSIADILRYSLNTGAIYVLKQLGGGEINEKARKTWHKYLTEHYLFGQKTGIEQGYEAEGSIPDPVEGFGRNIKYANAVFGQGLTVTPIQFAAAFASTINGGTYYQPHLVEREKPEVRKKDVVSGKVSGELRALHENSVDKRYPFVDRAGYKIGGKTGTAEVASPEGGYYDDRFDGTFIGYLGGDKPEYVIMVRIDDPKIYGYAGSVAAAPLFGKITSMLIDNFAVSPAGE
ncbi:penicillin-binding protein 2 [Candidatus Parcubacteria bacterium]|nr:penicillin-binding protein 2 [Candidatus Parcubacteria bacterium]